MFIHTTTYHAWQVGSTIRRVSCEKCSQEYFYELVRVGSGEATTVYRLNKAGASESASEKAHNNLQDMLSCCHDPVPCPACGTIQKKMRWQAALVRARRWSINAIACWVAGMITGAIYLLATQATRVGWWSFWASGAAFLIGIVYLYIRRKRYDEVSFAKIPKQHRCLLAPPALLLHVDDDGNAMLKPAKVSQVVTKRREFVAQFIRHGLPGVCMVCLSPTKHLYSQGMQARQTADGAIPCCETCSRRLKRRAWGALLGVLVCSACIAWLATGYLGTSESTRTSVTVLMSVVGLIVGFCCGGYVGSAMDRRDVDGWRGWSAIRPRSEAVAARLAEWYSQPGLYCIRSNPEFASRSSSR